MAVISWRCSGNWERFCSQEAFAKPQIRSFAEKVFDRDGHRCGSCGFRSRPSVEVFSGYMQICAIDRNYNNIAMDNWVTVCPYCHASLTAIHALKSKKFKLIAAPWISQKELFNFVRPLLIVGQDTSHPYYAEAISAYQQLDNLNVSIATLIPVLPASEGTPDENIYRFLYLCENTLTDEQYSNRSKFLHPLRMLPVKGQFRDESIYWNAAIYSQYHIRTWEKLNSCL